MTDRLLVQATVGTRTGPMNEGAHQMRERLVHPVLRSGANGTTNSFLDSHVPSCEVAWCMVSNMMFGSPNYPQTTLKDL